MTMRHRFTACAAALFAAFPACPASAQSPAATATVPAPAIEVRGIVLLASPADVRAGGWPATQLPAGRIDASRLPHLPPGFARQLAPLLDQRVPLEQITAAVTAALAGTRFPFAAVRLPPQEVCGGVVQVLLEPARVGRVRVEGARHFSEESYRSVVRAEPGGPIDRVALDEDMQWLGRNPFQRAAIVAEPGARPGEVDLVVRAQDRSPWRFTFGADDSGVPSTGREKINAGINWGDAFGAGAQFAYNVSGDTGFNRNVTHSFSLAQDLRWRHALRMNASFARVRPDMPQPLDSEGHSRQFSLRYDVPRVLPGAWTHTFSAGFDAKHSDNNLLFAAMPVSDNLTRLVQAVLGWQTQRTTEGGAQLGMEANLYLAPGGIGAYNDDEAFGASREGARARYAMANVQARAAVSLPDQLLWVSSGSLQLATTNLLGSEQLSTTGAYAVRGFDEGYAFGDQGVVWRNELHFPPVAVLSREGGVGLQDQLTPLVFIDAAVAGPRHPLPWERTSLTVASAGAGIRYQLGTTGSLRVDWAKPVYDGGDAGGSGRWHIAASLTW